MVVVRPTGLAGTWAGGAFTDINEATFNDANYIWSDDNTSATGSVTFDAIADIASSGTCTLRYRQAQADGGSAPSSGGSASSIGSIAVEGTTVWSTGLTTSEGSFAAQTVTFDASTITSSGTFTVDFNYSGGGGSPANRRGIAISWVEFEYPQRTPPSIDGVTNAPTVTGQSINLARSRLTTGQSQVVGLTGNSATLSLGRNLAADSQGYTEPNYWTPEDYATPEPVYLSLIGASANLTVAIAQQEILAQSDTISPAGQSATLSRSWVIQAQSDSIGLVGQSATLTKTWELDATSDAPVLTGQSADLAKGVTLEANSNAPVISGQSADLTKTWDVEGNSAALVLAGQTATLLTGKTLEANPATVSPAGFSANLTVGGAPAKSIEAQSNTISPAGQAATLSKTWEVQATADAPVLTGQSATLSKGLSLEANSNTIGPVGQSATLLYGRAVGGVTDTPVLTGQSAELQQTRSIDAVSNSITITGQSADLTQAGAPQAFTLHTVPEVLTPYGSSIILIGSAANQFARPGTDITTTNWQASTGTDLWAMVDETTPDDSDYVFGSTQNSTLELAFGALTDPGVNTGVTFRIRHLSTGGGQQERSTVGVYQGGTLIEEVISNTSIPRTITTETFTLQEANVANITNWSDLRFRYTITNIGGGEEVRVYWVELEVPGVAVTERTLGVVPNRPALTGQSATLTYEPIVNAVLNANPQSVTLVATSNDLQQSLSIDGQTNTIGLTGQQATLSKGLSINAQSNAVLVQTQTADLQRDLVLEAQTDAPALSGLGASVEAGRLLEGQAQAPTIQGLSATLTVGTVAASSIEANPDTIPLVGQQATLTVGRVVLATPAVVAPTTREAQTRLAYKLETTPSLPNLIRPANLLTYSGEVAPTGVPPLRFQHYLGQSGAVTTHLNQDIIQYMQPHNQLVYYIKNFYRIF